MILLSSADSFQNKYIQKILKEKNKVSNCLDPDQDQHSVGPDLTQICFQMLSADDKSLLLARKELKSFWSPGHGLPLSC